MLALAFLLQFALTFRVLGLGHGPQVFTNVTDNAQWSHFSQSLERGPTCSNKYWYHRIYVIKLFILTSCLFDRRANGRTAANPAQATATNERDCGSTFDIVARFV